ncbi:MAG: S8 family peptidase, partial [Bacteroidota bacterium]
LEKYHFWPYRHQCGQEQQHFFPASFENDNIFSIAAVDCDHARSSFSNFGLTNVDVAAMGRNVVAPDHTGAYKAKSGTSQATALVSGVAALLMTHLSNQHFEPVIQSIYHTVIPHASLHISSNGVMDANLAVIELLNNFGIPYRSSDEEQGLATEIQAPSIYPNPFRDFLTIDYQLESAGRVQFSIFDVMGRLVHQEERQTDAGIHQYQWEGAARLEGGMYILQWQGNGQHFSQTLIKE